MGPLRGPGSEGSERVVAASPQIKKRGRGWRRRLCRRVVFASAQGATALRAEG